MVVFPVLRRGMPIGAHAFQVGDTRPDWPIDASILARIPETLALTRVLCAPVARFVDIRP
jgi:hypothetical protein